MKNFVENIKENQNELKRLLPAEDILYYAFQTADKTNCLLCYADGMVNKELLGQLIAKPLSFLYLAEEKKSQNDPTMYKPSADLIEKTLRFPELKRVTDFQDAIKEILDGNTLLLIDGLEIGFIAGAKLLPVRAIMEPPTDVAVKGPREGFIEDIKTNMTLVRKRLKSPDLRMDTLRVGKRSDTAVVVCYLDKTVNDKVRQNIAKRIEQIQIDAVPDSSYIAAFLAPNEHSVFRRIGTTEKPDVFCAKLAEGRVGILVDGSPIALTAPYLLTEDLQSSEDYFISPFMATLMRLLRVFAIVAALLLPAFYITVQLFKMQLVPLGLMLTIASSIRELPLSPSMEMFVVLLLLEILKEASIRMPKYVGMSLSVVGALVLGETAVSAGFLSTPAIIIVAFSGICMYTVPAFVETGSILRWLFLLAAGSLGPFGIILFAVFILYYLLSEESYGAPLLAPFTPLIPHDLKDSFVKYGLRSLATRPVFLQSPNKTRLRAKK
ncbi:MAG: spore germination protein [Clostridia bacterium]|nr:spore germination protein [Clostridia bacterium]